MLKSILFITILFCFPYKGKAQIVNQNNTSNKENENKKEEQSKSNTETKNNFTTAYFSVGYFNTFRTFEDQTPYKTLYRWNTQTPTQNLGFNLGVYIPLVKHFDLDIGVNYLPFGEEYNFKDSLSDSTYHYINKYQQIGIPIRLKYTFINVNPSDLGFKPFISLGIVPSNILSIRYFSDYKSKDGSEIKNDVKKVTKDLNNFVFSTSLTVGLTYKTQKVAFIIQPEFRYNISNSYNNVFFKHNLWAWGVNAGIEMNF